MTNTYTLIDEALNQHNAVRAAELFNALPTKPNADQSRPSRITSHNVGAFLKASTLPQIAWAGEGSGAYRNQMMVEHKINVNNTVQSAAQFVLAMVKRLEADAFYIPFVCQHPIWKYFRSSASGGKNPILHIVARQNPDVRWVEAILTEYGAYLKDECHDTIISGWRGCLQWASREAVLGLECFARHGWLDLSSTEQLHFILEQAADRGQLRIVEWAVDQTQCPRVPGIEASLMKHKRLNGPKEPATITQAWDAMTQRWGMPPDDVLLSIWQELVKTKLVKPQPQPRETMTLIQTVETLIEQRMAWPDAQRSFLLVNAVATSNLEVITAYQKRGWKYPADSLEGCRINLEHQMARLGPSASERDERMLAFLKREILSHIPRPSTTPHKSKLAM